MLMQVKPNTFSKLEPKPGKDEKTSYFRVCKTNCPNCDTKRMTCCKK